MHSNIPTPSPENTALRSRFSTNTTVREAAASPERRVSRDYPPESSPPLEHTPLSHPPPLRVRSTPSPRLGSLPTFQQENVPQWQSITQPQPHPQCPDNDQMPEAGPSHVSTYGLGHNDSEEASHSNEQLISEDVGPDAEAEPLRLELPGFRPLSPIQLDFRLGSPSPSLTPSRGSKRRRVRGTGPYSSHSKSTSKSTTGDSSSKRSLRSLASAISGSVYSRASSLSWSSRSSSRERSGLARNHSCRVTFGEPPGDPCCFRAWRQVRDVKICRARSCTSDQTCIATEMRAFFSSKSM